MNIVGGFFNSPFSDNSTSLQVRKRDTDKYVIQTINEIPSAP